MSARQLEAARIALTRHIKRGGRVWIRVFPDKPLTKKPAETRMGKGKGSPEQWVAVVRPGRVIFEMEGVTEATRTRGNPSGGAQAVVPTQFRARGGSRHMRASEVRELSDEELAVKERELRVACSILRLR